MQVTQLCMLKLHLPLIVANSLNRDSLKIQSQCSTWEIKLNFHKTHSFTISRSKTPYQPHPPLILCGFNLEVSSFLKLLGVTLDDKLTFEKHICNIAASIAQKTGFIRNGNNTICNNDAVLKQFYAFILPSFSTVPLLGALHLVYIES